MKRPRKLLYVGLFLLFAQLGMRVWIDPAVVLLRVCGLPARSLLDLKLVRAYEDTDVRGDGENLYVFQANEHLFAILDAQYAANEQLHELPMGKDYRYMRDLARSDALASVGLSLQTIAALSDEAQGYWVYRASGTPPDQRIFNGGKYCVCAFYRREGMCIYYEFSL